MEWNWQKGLVVAFLTVLFLTSCQQRDIFYNNVQRSDVFVQAYADHRYDFLWVFDNSNSMAPQRQFVRDNMQNFLQILNSRKAIDYQMAMISTDWFTDSGALKQSAGGKKIIKSTDADPAQDFADVINSITDSPTAFWEQGLLSAKDAVFKYGSQFSRNGVPLIVIVLSDEQDWSCKDNCYGNEPENNPDWIPYETNYFVNFFKSVGASQNSDVHMFPIVGTDSSCAEIDSLGTRYMEVAEGLGGASASGSICDINLRDSFENVATVIADRGVKFKLNTEASGKGISVFINHVLVPYSPENYEYVEAENAIIFKNVVPKNGDVVEITYSQEVN